MRFHEGFWVVIGTAAPVIALAIIVALADARRESFSLYETVQRLAFEVNDADRAQVRRLITKVFRATFEFRALAMVNLLLQAGLLAVSLVSIANQENLVPPWLAVVAAVGGLLLLAFSSILSPIASPLKRAVDGLPPRAKSHGRPLPPPQDTH